MSQRIHVVDSHTAGEPTRVILSGGPPLGSGSMRERLEVFRRDFDHLRSATVNEPRGSDAMVGALLCAPQDPANSAGVIFFNNVGFLNMCGHGTIGLAVTLAHQGLIQPGLHRLETPAGIVTAELHPGNEVTVANVPAWREHANIAIGVEPWGTVRGDVAWGGNWFFLTHHCPCEISLASLEPLTAYCWAVRQALNASGYPDIDHIEVFGPARSPAAHGRNFVLCPGKAYDRSPCGTGTSAKLACLLADGQLSEGQVWRQESVIGSTFDGWITRQGDHLIPHIRGAAFITAEADLLLDGADPFRYGIPLK